MTRRNVTSHNEGAEPVVSFDLQWFDTIDPVRKRFIWGKRLPINSLSILAGPPGVGKTMISGDLAAGITRGTLEGEWDGAPHAVLMISKEDDPAEDLVPRTMAAGADLSKIAVVRKRVDAHERHLDLLPDLRAMAEQNLFETTDIRAIFISDTLLAHTPLGLDTNKYRDMEEYLNSLGAFARSHNLVIVGAMHTNKNEGKSAMSRLMGSTAIPGAARAAFIVGRDPQANADDDKQRFVLARLKANGVPDGDVPSLTYWIDDASFIHTHPDGTDETLSAGRIVWGEESDLDCDDLVRQERESPKSDECDQRIINALAPSPLLAQDLQAEVMKKGANGTPPPFSRRTFEARRSALRKAGEIKSARHGNAGPYYWFSADLPATEAAATVEKAWGAPQNVPVPSKPLLSPEASREAAENVIATVVEHYDHNARPEPAYDPFSEWDEADELDRPEDVEDDPSAPSGTPDDAPTDESEPPAIAENVVPLHRPLPPLHPERACINCPALAVLIDGPAWCERHASTPAIQRRRRQLGQAA